MSARHGRRFDMNDIPTKPPRFPFLGVPGKALNITWPDDFIKFSDQHSCSVIYC